MSDLNGRPTDYKSVALPAELKWQIKLVTPTGIEPMSPPWKGDVLTAWPRGQINSLNKLMVSHRGIEPRTTWLKVKCSTNWASDSYKMNDKVSPWRNLFYYRKFTLSTQNRKIIVIFIKKIEITIIYYLNWYQMNNYRTKVVAKIY